MIDAIKRLLNLNEEIKRDHSIDFGLHKEELVFIKDPGIESAVQVRYLVRSKRLNKDIGHNLMLTDLKTKIHPQIAEEEINRIAEGVKRYLMIENNEREIGDAKSRG